MDRVDTLKDIEWGQHPEAGWGTKRGIDQYNLANRMLVMMKSEVGNPDFPIWLLGDSNPKGWQQKLAYPLDSRHPARHNIWTSVVDQLQNRVFRADHRRLDTSRLYIRNAVQDPSDKPHDAKLDWPRAAVEATEHFAQQLASHHPVLVISFGSFAFEFGRRSVAESPRRSARYWRTAMLGKEFRHRIGSLNETSTNLIPLLHVSIARRYFLKSHDEFCDKPNANYFKFVGEKLADALLNKLASLPIWIR
jgi:hypothetical protein